MRKLLLLLTLTMPAACFANTFSCPGNGNFIEKGEALSKVISICGSPVSSRSYTKTISKTEEMTFYKPQASGRNEKITLMFINERLANISVYNSDLYCNPAVMPYGTQCPSVSINVQTTGECGYLLNVGSSKNSALQICGQPAEQKVLSSTLKNVTELKYNGAGQNTLVLEDGILTDWVY